MTPSLFTQLNKIHFFTLESYMQIAGLKESEKAKARNRLSRAVRSGVILRVKKGIYITKNFYSQNHQDERFNLVVSQIINPFSYISSLTVLQRASLLTEATYPITAMTQKQTSEVTNLTGTYTYQFIKPDLYTGFSSYDFLGLIYHMASIGKALFDYLYLKPIPRAMRAKGVSLANELRLNLSSLSQRNKQTFEEFVQLSQSEKMMKILGNFKEYSWHL